MSILYGTSCETILALKRSLQSTNEPSRDDDDDDDIEDEEISEDQGLDYEENEINHKNVQNMEIKGNYLDCNAF